MAKRKYSEVEMTGALKQMEARRKIAASRYDVKRARRATLATNGFIQAQDSPCRIA